jgi:hypothetical protein
LLAVDHEYKVLGGMVDGVGPSVPDGTRCFEISGESGACKQCPIGEVQARAHVRVDRNPGGDGYDLVEVRPYGTEVGPPWFLCSRRTFRPALSAALSDLVKGSPDQLDVELICNKVQGLLLGIHQLREGRLNAQGRRFVIRQMALAAAALSHEFQAAGIPPFSSVPNRHEGSWASGSSHHPQQVAPK